MSLLREKDKSIIKLREAYVVLRTAVREVVKTDADYPTQEPGVSRLKHCVFLAKEAIKECDEIMENK